MTGGTPPREMSANGRSADNWPPAPDNGPMPRRLATALVFLLVIAGGLALRLPRLADRPLHNDEGVNTYKFDEVWTTGRFDYQTIDFHGPSLYYLTLPAAWLSGAREYGQTNEWTYRMVAVMAGAWLIAVPYLLRRPLGTWAAIWAAVLAAASPGLVFYSRYYIHEMLLALFTIGAIVTGWRFTLKGRWRWAVGTGVWVGMMAATKETWVIHAFAAVVGVVGVWLYDRARGERGMAGVHVGPGRVLAGAGVALVAFVLILVTMYSNFFRDFGGDDSRTLWARSGLEKFVDSYVIYFKRGTGGEGVHTQPFGYYLQILTWYQAKKGAPVFTEWLIVGTSALGVIFALVLRAKRPEGAGDGKRKAEPQTARLRRGSDSTGVGVGAKREHPLLVDDAGLPTVDYAHPHTPRRKKPHRYHHHHAPPSPSIPFVRFMAFYTIALTLVYSALAYKTPWCMVTFVHGMTILGGFAVARLVRWTPTVAGKGLVSAAVLVGVYFMLLKVDQANGLTEKAAKRGLASHEFNPYAHTPTTRNLYDPILRTIEEVGSIRADGFRGKIQIVGKEIWPLPFYLRRFTAAAYYDHVPENLRVLDADLIVGPEELGDKLAFMEGKQLAALRPREKSLYLYAPPAVWERWLAQRRGEPLPPLPGVATRPATNPVTPGPTPTPVTAPK